MHCRHGLTRALSARPHSCYGGTATLVVCRHGHTRAMSARHQSCNGGTASLVQWCHGHNRAVSARLRRAVSARPPSCSGCQATLVQCRQGHTLAVSARLHSCTDGLATLVPLRHGHNRVVSAWPHSCCVGTASVVRHEVLTIILPWLLLSLCRVSFDSCLYDSCPCCYSEAAYFAHAWFTIPFVNYCKHACLSLSSPVYRTKGLTQRVLPCL